VSTLGVPSNIVATIPEAITAMRDLGATLDEGDGVGCFNSMYLQVTEAVASRLDAGVFSDPEFMDRLDVNFANLYLDACARSAGSTAQPACASWRALFDRRADSRITPLQFALAGMNAHINHDLPLAVTVTAEQLNRPPSSAGVYEDFTAVNDILSEADDAVRLSLQGPLASALDKVGGPLDDAIGAWGIARARQAAWGQALRLWEVRPDPPLYERFLLRLDRVVALAGRCLLTPAGSSPQRLLTPAFELLDSFSDRVADLLWGDEVFDGEDDGIIGALLWAARSADVAEEPDTEDDSFLEQIAERVLSRLGDIRRAI
jgi:hypothetical protein